MQYEALALLIGLISWAFFSEIVSTWVSDKQKPSLTLVAACVFSCICCALLLDKYTVEKHTEKQTWLDKGCPAISVECGSKNKYACDIAVTEAGKRFKHGDAYVLSRKTCDK